MALTRRQVWGKTRPQKAGGWVLQDHPLPSAVPQIILAELPVDRAFCQAAQPDRVWTLVPGVTGHPELPESTLGRAFGWLTRWDLPGLRA